MLKKIKTGIKILKEKGVKNFLIALCEFCGRKIFLSNIQKNPSRLIKKIKNFNSQNPDEVFDFSWKFSFGFIRPSQIKEEFVELLKIFQELKPKYILEIGTSNGGNLFCFCKLAPGDATIISIDLPEGKFGGGYPEWKIPIYRAFKKESQKFYLLRKDSHQKETLDELLKILNGNFLDFLFIDGDHSYEGVKKDFEMYGPLVKEGGIISFHDVVFGPKENVGGVPEFWQEIKNNFNFREFVKDFNQKGYGIGVIFK